MDYENDIKIDENALDVEWLDQASLAMKYGRHWAECQQKFQRTEEKIKLVRSELIAEVNSNPEKTLGEGIKPTGPNIESFYRNHIDHIKAKEDWVEAQYQLNVADIAKWEISHTRKIALENLVKLHGQNYFAGPSVPRDLGYEAQQKHAQKKSDNKVARKMTRIKK